MEKEVETTPVDSVLHWRMLLLAMVLSVDVGERGRVCVERKSCCRHVKSRLVAGVTSKEDETATFCLDGGKGSLPLRARKQSSGESVCDKNRKREEGVCERRKEKGDRERVQKSEERERREKSE